MKSLHRVGFASRPYNVTIEADQPVSEPLGFLGAVSPSGAPRVTFKVEGDDGSWFEIHAGSRRPGESIYEFGAGRARTMVLADLVADANWTFRLERALRQLVDLIDNDADGFHHGDDDTAPARDLLARIAADRVTRHPERYFERARQTVAGL